MEGLSELKEDIKEIKTALLGSPLSPSSVIKRLKDAEEKIEALEAKEVKNNIYFNILIFVSITVAGRAIQLLLTA